MPKRRARRAAPCVRHPAQRDVARVVAKTERGEDVDRPELARVLDEVGRAVAGDGRAERVLEEVAGAADVVGELVARLRRHLHVRVAVARDLVTAGGDATDDGAAAAHDVTEDEERGARAGGVEQLEHALYLGLDGARQRVPIDAAVRPPIVVEPLLDVDRQRVACAVARHLPRIS